MKLFLLLLFLFSQKTTCYRVEYTASKGKEIIRSSEDTCMNNAPNFVDLTVWIQGKRGCEKVKIVGVYPK